MRAGHQQRERLLVDRNRHVALLRADADLRAAVPASDRAVAERLVIVPAIELDPGAWTAESLGADGHAFAALLLRGLVTREIAVAARHSADLFGPGDILHPWRTSPRGVGGPSRWASGTRVLAAILDDRFLAAARRWPGLFGVVHDRLAEQLDRAAARAAVMVLPRVDERVLGLFWQLAERWGKVRPDGVVVELALTHELIGQLIGAQRPTVSLALQALDRDGLLQRNADGSWLLAPESIDLLAPAAAVGAIHTAAPSRGAGRDGARSAPVTALADRRDGHGPPNPLE
jgi:CRP/FNR family transcriptional regulator, cyclic AMP receptor protein